MPITRWPTDEEMEVAFEDYVSALGKVAHAWNYMQEALGNLFVTVAEIDHFVGLAVWFSTQNDRTQREMLRAAAKESSQRSVLLGKNSKAAVGDVEWLLNRADELSIRRNAAVHVACSMVTSGDQTEVAATFYSQNPLAAHLKGKRLLDQFAWFEACAEALTLYARAMETSLKDAHSAWPHRPSMPTLVHSTSRKAPRRKEPPKRL